MYTKQVSGNSYPEADGENSKAKQRRLNCKFYPTKQNGGTLHSQAFSSERNPMHQHAG